MYTLVLMAALSSGPDSTEFGGLFRRSQSCSGCSGCTGSCHGSCTGSCYGSCTGTSYSCYGSCSGSCTGSGWRFGSRIRAFFSRKESCYGSCSGKSFACYGSCMGSTSCCGGGVTMPMMNGCPTCESLPPGAIPLGSPMPIGDPYSATPFPATPGISTPGMATPFPPLPTTPGSSVPPAVPTPAPPPPSVGENPGTTGLSRTTASAVSQNSGRATVVVHLPADAKLYAEGQLLTLTSSERSFITPILPSGADYGYTFRVEYTRNGETISQSRKIGVRAGGIVNVEFIDLTQASRPAAPQTQPIEPTAHTTATADTSAPAKPTSTAPTINPFLAGTAPHSTNTPATSTVTNRDRARLIVRMPTEAVLYVDGRKVDGTGPLREFTTPQLPVGRDFSYVMKTETMRNGRPESSMQKVMFRAGEIVSVDFATWAQ